MWPEWSNHNGGGLGPKTNILGKNNICPGVTKFPLLTPNNKGTMTMGQLRVRSVGGSLILLSQQPAALWLQAHSRGNPPESLGDEKQNYSQGTNQAAGLDLAPSQAAPQQWQKAGPHL
ncbi:hypothetical protein NPIL_358771 [Nephila pilipes]|uniref:Uncharacterized protein n=1 Tax=Nephila pilipes TaxID=299642 RepID=A0A8X6MU88_NEPPI|nr:hypothetical protein NPIL_369091 [Nephila pilipes]GFS88086.1 hypothetical protein NPIL_358771 [Nephila pilipes]